MSGDQQQCECGARAVATIRQRGCAVREPICGGCWQRLFGSPFPAGAEVAASIQPEEIEHD